MDAGTYWPPLILHFFGNQASKYTIKSTMLDLLQDKFSYKMEVMSLNLTHILIKTIII